MIELLEMQSIIAMTVQTVVFNVRPNIILKMVNVLLVHNFLPTVFLVRI